VASGRSRLLVRLSGVVLTVLEESWRVARSFSKSSWMAFSWSWEDLMRSLIDDMAFGWMLLV
jgi:hypothetical protein